MTEIETFLKNYGEKLKNINEIVLNKKYALDFLDILKKHKKFILGGDVYEKDGDDFYPTYDSWYMNIDDGTAEQSYIKAKKYIENSGDDKYFVIVVK
jgi:hypothetical protein